MIAVLLTFVFALHLLCMNVAGAGPLVCFWLEWREGKGSDPAGRAGRYLAGVSLVAFVVGMLLGLIYGWAGWSPEYGKALSLVGSRVYFGVWELGFSLVLMAAHWAWWRAVPSPSVWQRGGRALLPILSSTNLLYHFPFLFVILAQLLAGSDSDARPLTSAEFRARMGDGLVLARVVHFWLASFAVAGMVLLGYALRLRRSGVAADESDEIAILGGRIALVPTLLQIPVGLWLLTQLSGESQGRLMGNDLVGTGLFGASVFGAAWLMHQLAAIALGDARHSKLIGSMGALVAIVILMTGTLMRIRG